MIARPRSITLRISLLFSGLTAIVLLIMGYLIMVSVDHHFDEQDSQAIRGKLELIQNILTEYENGDDATVIDAAIIEKLRDALVGHHELSVLVTTPRGELFRTAHAEFLAQFLTTAQPYQPDQPLPLQKWHKQKGHPHHGVAVLLNDRAGAQKYRVVIAIDPHQHTTFMRMFKLQLLLVGVAGLLAMGALGWFVTRRGLMPVSDMARVAEGISAQQLGDRLQLVTLPSELHSLAISFNDMLDRLENSLQRLSGFASDIAHELRTPINNLMTQTQVSLSRTRSADDYREILYSNLEEYERLARMIADMLFLAKADNGLVIPHQENIQLETEIRALFEFYDALAAEKNLRMEITGNGNMQGDRLMIQRALGNLLSNAIRHSTAGTTISASLQQHDDTVQITLCNQGDSISPAQLERIFDRFYRADASRTRSDEGAGLGLAITRSIIEAHRGSIQAESAQGNTCFIVQLPAT